MTDPATEIIPIDRLELAFAPSPWEFAQARRAEIDAHFAAARRKKPAMFNGQVLLLREWTIESAVLRGTFLATDFASFMTWRDFGCPDAQVTNCFAMGELRGSDGAALMGVMAPHTANAGMIYFPAGTPDPSDIVGDRVDLDVSVWREVAEETGLTPDDIVAAPGWTALRSGPVLCLMKSMRARSDAVTLRQTVRARLAAEARPEFSDFRIVRGEGDLDPAMPHFVAAYLRHLWS